MKKKLYPGDKVIIALTHPVKKYRGLRGNVISANDLGAWLRDTFTDPYWVERNHLNPIDKSN